MQRNHLAVLPPTWKWVPFAQVCERVSVGHVGPTSAFFRGRSEGVLFLRSQNVRPGRLDLEGATAIAPEFHAKLRKSQLKAGDILIVRVGANRGDCCVLPDGLGEVNCANIVFARPKHPTGFHAAFLQSDMGRNLLLSASVGAAQGVINTSSVADTPVPLPPLAEERRIADILSAYGRLIENSQRRIRILEEMARALYREWFVHFRFPGDDDSPHVASAAGRIPEGWKVKKLSEVAVVNRAQINARTAPEELYYIDISSVSPGRVEALARYDFADAPGRARRIIRHGDILWSCVRPNRRSHAQVLHPRENTIASTGFAVLTATAVPFTFLYLASTEDDFVAYLANSATGAAYPAVTAATFERAELVIPTKGLLERFAKITIPMAEEIHVLQHQIENLRRTGELLLPRLMSGQIELATD